MSFVCPRELVSFDPWHVTHSPPMGKRISQHSPEELQNKTKQNILKRTHTSLHQRPSHEYERGLRLVLSKSVHVCCTVR